MAAAAMDAPSSFAYLVDNIPTWTTQITELSVYATKKHAEFVQEYVNLVKHIKPKRIKSPSLASIHSEDAHGSATSIVKIPSSNDLPTPPPRIEIDPLEAGNKYLYAQTQRKRKPDGSIRSGASGPQAFRSKHQVIIYYDAYVQEQLDTIVKSIGVARNNLRKGKNALVVAKGFQLPSLTRRYDSPYSAPSLENLRGLGMSRSSPMLVGGKPGRQPPPQRAQGDEAAFLRTDKELEGVQQVCETAAHQFLRDGDCKLELETVNRRLDTILIQAKETVEQLQNAALQQQKPENVEHSLSSVPSLSSDQVAAVSDATRDTRPSLGVMDSDITSKMTPNLSQTLADMNNRANVSAPAIPQAVEAMSNAAVKIEVDSDSDNGSIIVDLSQYRRANAAGMRA